MDVQIEAVKGLLSRLLPSHARIFRLEATSYQQGASCFEVRVQEEGTVHVLGTSGVRALTLLCSFSILSYVRAAQLDL